MLLCLRITRNPFPCDSATSDTIAYSQWRIKYRHVPFRYLSWIVSMLQRSFSHCTSDSSLVVDCFFVLDRNDTDSRASQSTLFKENCIQQWQRVPLVLNDSEKEQPWESMICNNDNYTEADRCHSPNDWPCIHRGEFHLSANMRVSTMTHASDRHLYQIDSPDLSTGAWSSVIQFASDVAAVMSSSWRTVSQIPGDSPMILLLMKLIRFRSTSLNESITRREHLPMR